MSAKKDQINEIIYEEEFVGPTKEFRVLGMLAYVPGGFILPYLLGHSDKPFVLFHVKQGFIMFSIFVLISILPIPSTFGFALFIYFMFGGWHGYKAFHGKEYQMQWVISLLKAFPSEEAVRKDPLGTMSSETAPQESSLEKLSK